MEEVQGLYLDLSNAAQKSDHEKIADICSKLLKVDGKDADASHCLVVSLIHQSKYADALKVIESNPSLSSRTLFEKAYLLYRTNKLAEALDTLQRITATTSVGHQHLQAQVLYRLMKFESSVKMYEKIIADSKSAAADVKTNYMAALASNATHTDVKVQDIVSSKELQDSHELAYNVACYHLERGDYDQANRILQLAQKVCRDSMTADDATEDEIADELAVLLVQSGYVAQMLGNADDAMQLYNSVLKNKPSDAAVAAVASNNIVSLKKERNLFDSLKKSKTAASEALDTKLSSKQKLVIACNRALLLLYMNKGDQCREVVQGIVKQFPDSDVPVLIMAALAFKEKKLAKCEEPLKAYAAKYPDKSARVLLALAQMQLQQNAVRAAIATLESIASLRDKPGMVRSLVRLYLHMNDPDAALRTLTTALTALDNTMDVDGSKVAALRLKYLEEMGEVLVHHKRFSEAADVYQRLHAMDPAKPVYLYRLIQATAASDPHRAAKLESELPAMPRSMQADPDVLENIAAPRLDRKLKPSESMRKKRPAEGAGGEEHAKKKRKKRKKRLPKNYDPNVPPDPERWLPKELRSSYKKGKGKKGAVGKGPQGALPSQVSTASATHTEQSQSKAPAPTAAAIAAAEKKGASAAAPAAARKKGRR
mmetsp:Transcript_22936/g.39296  ORF Transcript_22936/g.39296 Transcript_22936/m.39296 type:complete len:654 (+) Transcript_22936:53-2014(+)